ncbi:MAG: GBS Bsp-like repeat-containing protein [Bacillota bacterium]|nr:GBS Bsp-like repeat-containing protein [Bacillota bacterium]
MKKMSLIKKLFVSMLFCGFLLVAIQQTAFAWGAAAHYTIMQQTANGYGGSFPSDSKIAAAMRAYPGVAAWGAVGPDLGYSEVRMAVGGYAPWGDVFHYDRVGTFAATLLKNALASGDQKKIAFAAGYLTHVMGDMNCHGTFVYPECGVYLDNASGRDLHQKLEKAADSYVWVNFGGKSSSSYTSSGVNSYFGEFPADFFAQNISTIYGYIPVTKLTGTTGWEGLMRSFGIGNGASYSEALSFLNSVRTNRISQAFRDSCVQSAALLMAAERGDYSGFKDSWNLDAANENRPFGALKVQVSTTTDALCGTDDNVYFGMKFADGRVYEKMLDKDGYNDFETGDNDPYYLYIGDKTLDPRNVRQVWIKKVYDYWSDDWRIKDVSISVNGVGVYSQSLNMMLNKNTKQWIVNVNGLPSDTEGPTAASVTYSYTPGSTVYTVTVSGVTDPNGVSKVQFPTWSTVLGQDDLVWYDGVYIGNNQWQFTVDAYKHYLPPLTPLGGEFNTHVYGWDGFGNMRCLGGVIVNVVTNNYNGGV